MNCYSFDTIPFLKAEVIDARTITLKLPKKGTTSCKEGKFIKELTHSSGLTITQNTTVIVNKSPYKIQKIDEKVSEDKVNFWYYLRTQKLSKTSQLIVPLLGIKRTTLLYDTQFCNAFIGIEDIEYGEFLYLLYRYSEEEDYTLMEEELLSSDSFISSSSPDKYHILYKFKFPEYFKQDIQKIINGKYSTISNEAKFCILQFVKGNKDTQMGQILYLGPSRKKQLEEEIGEVLPANAELLSIFDPSKEVFLNQFKIDYESVCRNTTETCSSN